MRVLPKPGPFVTELNTHLAQESEKQKEAPGEGEAAEGPAAASRPQGESADQTMSVSFRMSTASFLPPHLSISLWFTQTKNTEERGLREV